MDKTFEDESGKTAQDACEKGEEDDKRTLLDVALAPDEKTQKNIVNPACKAVCMMEWSFSHGRIILMTFPRDTLMTEDGGRLERSSRP